MRDPLKAAGHTQIASSPAVRLLFSECWNSEQEEDQLPNFFDQNWRTSRISLSRFVQRFDRKLPGSLHSGAYVNYRHVWWRYKERSKFITETGS